MECQAPAEIVVMENPFPSNLRETMPADLVVEAPAVLLYQHVWGVDDPDAE